MSFLGNYCLETLMNWQNLVTMGEIWSFDY